LNAAGAARAAGGAQLRQPAVQVGNTADGHVALPVPVRLKVNTT
jgi:hypothetical protein